MKQIIKDLDKDNVYLRGKLTMISEWCKKEKKLALLTKNASRKKIADEVAALAKIEEGTP